MQFVCALLAIGTLGALIGFLGLSRRRPATIIRSCALSLALACAAGSIIIVAPQLNAALKLYWAAARVGDMAAVTVHKSAVDSLHPIASKLMGGTIICVLLAFIAGLWSVTSSSPGIEPPRPSQYEQPALLRGKRA